MVRSVFLSVTLYQPTLYVPQPFGIDPSLGLKQPERQTELYFIARAEYLVGTFLCAALFEFCSI